MLKAHFTKELFKFLRELKKNNNKKWFEKNKPRYEEHLKNAALAFVADIQIPLEVMAPRIHVDPRPNGGSLFRIYRDVRFSKDKSPYKTHCGIQFRHRAGKDAHAPGFYVHLEPGEVFVGGGVWHPEGKVLDKIRRAIQARPDEWKSITRSATFKRNFELWGERLKRPPRGFDPEDPMIEDIKMKDYIALRGMSEKDAVSPKFLPEVVKTFEKMVPLMRFLAKSGGYLW